MNSVFYIHLLREDTVVELKKFSTLIKKFKLLTFQICLE